MLTAGHKHGDYNPFPDAHADGYLLDTLHYLISDTCYSHGDDVPFLVADAVLRVGVLADHAVQAAVGHLGVARAGQVHRQHLASQQVTATAVPQF